MLWYGGLAIYTALAPILIVAYQPYLRPPITTRLSCLFCMYFYHYHSRLQERIKAYRNDYHYTAANSFVQKHTPKQPCKMGISSGFCPSEGQYK